MDTFRYVAYRTFAGKTNVLVSLSVQWVGKSWQCSGDGFAGNITFGCDLVEDRLAQALSASVKRGSVTHRQVGLVAQHEVELRAVSASNEIMLAAAPEVYCNATAAGPQQQQVHSSSNASILSQACQTSVSSARICSKSGTPTTMFCLAASRSSRTATWKSCGSAPTVQQDTCISGRPVCMTAQEAPNAHTVKGKEYVSTALLLPKHRANWSTGTTTRMLRRLSRCLRAVTSGLSGSAQSVATSGKVKLHDVCSMTADVLVAVTKLLEGKQSGQRLKQHDIRFCVNGTMSAMLQMAFIPSQQHHPWQQQACALGLPQLPWGTAAPVSNDAQPS